MGRADVSVCSHVDRHYTKITGTVDHSAAAINYKLTPNDALSLYRPLFVMYLMRNVNENFSFSVGYLLDSDPIWQVTSRRCEMEYPLTAIRSFTIC